VVIPETIRKRLKLKAGAQFVVVGEADVVILKIVESPELSEFDAIIQDARKQGKKAGLKQKDVAAAIVKARGR
jgi:bifunctional DNA-binding transcriptional regulator/antitoxin component of YhaV-PrlF toxin-antitoxin module